LDKEPNFADTHDKTMAPSVRVVPTPDSSIHEKAIKNSQKNVSDIDPKGRMGLSAATDAASVSTTTKAARKPAATTTTTMMTTSTTIPFEKKESTIQQQKQQHPNQPGDLAIRPGRPEVTGTGNSTATSSMPSSMYSMSYPVTPNVGSLYPGNMYYGGTGGMGMYGMMSSPYSGMYPPMMGPFATWNQYLMGIQNFVFSIGQVVQVRIHETCLYNPNYFLYLMGKNHIYTIIFILFTNHTHPLKHLLRG
jgi:hypothetical protein